MPWAIHPADTVGTPADPGPWAEAADLGATLVSTLLTIAQGQVTAYAPALAAGAEVPPAYRYAQVLQARDNWQASRRVGDSVAVGDTAYAIRVRPLSDAVRSMLRPPEAVPSFASTPAVP